MTSPYPGICAQQLHAEVFYPQWIAQSTWNCTWAQAETDEALCLIYQLPVPVLHFKETFVHCGKTMQTVFRFNTANNVTSAQLLHLTTKLQKSVP